MEGQQDSQEQVVNQPVEKVNHALPPSEQQATQPKPGILSTQEAGLLFSLAKNGVTDRLELQKQLLTNKDIRESEAPRLLEYLDTIPDTSKNLAADMLTQALRPLVMSRLPELSPEDREDVSQEVFAALWNDIKTGKDIQNLPAYVSSVVKLQKLNYIRDQKALIRGGGRVVSLEGFLSKFSGEDRDIDRHIGLAAPQEPGPEDKIVDSKYQYALARLTAQEKLLIQALAKQKSEETLAAEMGITIGHLRVQIFRMRRMFTRLVQEYKNKNPLE